MRNVYSVNLSSSIKIEAGGHHISGKDTSWVFVVASSFENVVHAVKVKYPEAEIKSITLLNYSGVPIVSGD